MKRLDEVNDPEAGVVRVQPVVYLGRSIHRISRTSDVWIDWFHIVHHPDRRILL